MPHASDRPIYILALGEDDFTNLCHLALFARSPGEIPLPLTTSGQRLLYLTHLAYERVAHPGRIHPCRHCRPGAMYAPPRSAEADR